MLNKIYQHFLQVRSVSTDSRNIQEGCIYFALKGDHFNGNDYAVEALKKGASMAVVDEPMLAHESDKIVLVKDVLGCLQDLARFHRDHLDIPVIGLTGSNGKTTSKELLTQVLSTKFRTISTKGNLNNHIGVPLTILSIRPEHEIAVVEMGANHQKEIEFLCSISKPNIGFITNFGLAHLEGFGGKEGVIKGKSELYRFLESTHGKVLYNADDQKQEELSRTIIREGFSFSNKPSTEQMHVIGKSETCTITWNDIQIRSNLVGDYNATNLAFAILGGVEFGIPPEDIKYAIEAYIPENNRSQLLKTENNTVIVDCYNANPSSMQSAIENASRHYGKDVVLILGDMFELGDSSEIMHKEVVDLIESLGIKKVYLVGEYFHKIESKPNYRSFQYTVDLYNYLNENRLEKVNILLKGSRGMALEKLLPLL